MGPLAAQKKALAGAGIKGLVIEPWFGAFVPAHDPCRTRSALMPRQLGDLHIVMSKQCFE
jgi:hypothetical protein